jgi:hypothetical protein
MYKSIRIQGIYLKNSKIEEKEPREVLEACLGSYESGLIEMG